MSEGDRIINHVLVCGLGELGVRTVEHLLAFGEQVVVLDPRPKPEPMRQLAEWGVRLIPEPCTSPRALIAVTDAAMTYAAMTYLVVARGSGDWRKPVPADWVLELGDAVVVVVPRPTWLDLHAPSRLGSR